MTELIVRVGGVEHRLSPGQTASLGRAPTNTIVCSAEAVSGTHAHLAFEAGNWVFRDASTNGSFVNGQRTPAFAISSPVSVVLGHAAQGALVELLPVASTAPASPFAPVAPVAPVAPPPDPPPDPPTSPGNGGGFLSTQILPKELGGTPAAAPPNPASDVKIQYEGGEFVARPGQVVTFGREPGSLVMLDNPTVSRRHAHLFLTNEGWILEDLNSSRGLTIDGQSVRRTVLQGTSEVWFGPEEAGVRVIFIAPGLNPRTVEKKGVPAWAIAVPVAVVALIALTALGLVLTRNATTSVATTPLIPPTMVGNGSASSAPAANTPAGPDLVALKKATVRIEGRFKLSASERKRVDQAKKDEGVDPSAADITGSGTIISADGLILTNAHVATPDLKKSSGDSLPPIDTLMVALNRNGDDEPLLATEAAEVVVSDPDLDLAVIRISTDGNLPALPIGDDTTVHSGDELLVLGFPAVAGSGAVTVTRGVVGSFVADKTMGTERAWINTDAKIDPGNSGGLAANREGAIIGVPTVICFEPIGSSKTGGRESRQNRVRAIDVAKPIIAAAKEGTTYESPGADKSACGQ